MPYDDSYNASSGEGSNYLDKLFGAAVDIGTSFGKAAIYGKEKAYEQDIIDERIRLAQLNGSGPVSPNLAKQSPASWYDFAFGQGVGQPGVASVQGNQWILLALAGGLAFLLLFMVLRR